MTGPLAYSPLRYGPLSWEPLTTPLGEGPGSSFIGGVAVGTQGTSGIYSGYTMAGGDDFVDALNVVNVGAPLAKYFTTHIYGAGARSVGSPLDKSFDMDPYFTGAQDSNRGVPVGTNTMSQSSSILTLNARIANSGEIPNINGRPIVSSMIHTGGYLTVSPPCIIEARCSFTSGNPMGWHPTFWVMNSNPLSIPSTGTPGWLEFDFPECNSTQTTANTNIHGSPGGSWANDSTTITAVQGTGYHLFSLVITSSSVLWYVDGTLVKTESHDGTITGNPYYVLLTNHTFNGTFGTDTSVDVPAWTAAGTTGATMNVDYYRSWIPNANYPSLVIKPSGIVPSATRIDYNTSINYTFPTSASLWGAGITDYLQSIRKEDFEPGANVEGSGAYTTQFPAGITFNSGTRNISGIPTANSPGRLHIMAVPNVIGGLNYAWRDYIDIGPTVTILTLSASVGVPYSHDVYPETPCGILLPKTLAVSGLPTGLTFSPTTGLITGTASSAGSSSVTITVTNSNGQVGTKTMTMTVSAGGALGVDGTPISASGTGVTSQATSITTTGTNEILLLNVCATGVSVDPTNTSVTDSQGLTWTKRVSKVTSTTSGTESALWWALAPTATTYVVTANFASSVGARTILAAITGANTTTPFDTDASLPASAIALAATTTTRTISTQHANDMIVAFIRGAAAMGTITEPSGFTQFVNAGTAQDGCFKIVSTTQSSVGVQYSWTTSTNVVSIVDVIQGS